LPDGLSRIQGPNRPSAVVEVPVHPLGVRLTEAPDNATTSQETNHLFPLFPGRIPIPSEREEVLDLDI
jgi:hypothetical protein